MTEIFEQMANYISSLDWAYILTFILIAYGLNHYKVTDWFYKLTNLKIRTRYRVLIIGVLYGILLYFIRGYSIKKVECLLRSFVFAMVFHKLLLEIILNKIVTPKNVTK